MIVSLTGPHCDYAAGGGLHNGKGRPPPAEHVMRIGRSKRLRHLSVLPQVRQDGGGQPVALGIGHDQARDRDKLIRKLYAARVVGDIDAMVAAPCLPTCISRLPATPRRARWPGGSRGADKLRPQLAQLVKAFTFHSYDITALVVEGSRAAVRAKANITSVTTGATVDMELADFIEVKDGRIVSFVQFIDTALAARLATK